MTETLPQPASRKEQYLATIAGMTGIDLPEPASRIEEYLNAIAQNGGGGGGTSDFNNLTNRPKYNGTTMSSSTDIPAVPTVAQSTGSSTTSVMSQDAVTTALSGKEDKGQIVQCTILPQDWGDISGDVYTKFAYAVPQLYMGDNATVELVNDNPELFAQFGFAINGVVVMTNRIEIVSMGAPESSVTLTFEIKGAEA